jgi:arsenate reductase (thioredoxin)
MKILFVDVDNGAASVMAQRMFNRLTEGEHSARSCGVHPAASVDPLAAEAMREVGINLRTHVPRGIDSLSVVTADLVIAIGRDPALKSFAPDRTWELDIPASEEPEDFRRLRDCLLTRVLEIATELGRGDSQHPQTETEIAALS